MGSAVEMSVGATSWYAWLDISGTAEVEKYDIDPELLYGPVLSAKINDDFNLTFVFLYGVFNVKETDTDGSVYKYDMSRIDSDIALNYRLNSYFKLFIGGKYMSYKYKLDDFDYSGNDRAFGPGTGISVVLPIGGNFFLIGNVGGFYLWGKEDQSGEYAEEPDAKFKDYGINTTASIAYYIEPASTTINLGGRYQYLKSKYDGDEPDDTTKFYGITLSATYSFSI